MNFPNASESFRAANPALLTHPGKKNSISGRVGMNKTESEYAFILEAMRRNGEIAWFGFEKITLRLADRTSYTPDFMTIEPLTQALFRRIKFIEIKGFRRDDAMVKFKVAREQFHWADFEMWSKTKKGWKQIL